MNATLQSFARQQLKAGLEKLPVGWQEKFKLMYARDGGKRSVEDAKAMTIDAVVKQMPDDKLDWAMHQVENSMLALASESQRKAAGTADGKPDGQAENAYSGDPP